MRKTLPRVLLTAAALCAVSTVMPPIAAGGPAICNGTEIPSQRIVLTVKSVTVGGDPLAASELARYPRSAFYLQSGCAPHALNGRLADSSPELVAREVWWARATP